MDFKEFSCTKRETLTPTSSAVMLCLKYTSNFVQISSPLGLVSRGLAFIGGKNVCSLSKEELQNVMGIEWLQVTTSQLNHCKSLCLFSVISIIFRVCVAKEWSLQHISALSRIIVT